MRRPSEASSLEVGAPRSVMGFTGAIEPTEDLTAVVSEEGTEAVIEDGTEAVIEGSRA
jgi:hypothetical protein